MTELLIYSGSTLTMLLAAIFFARLVGEYLLPRLELARGVSGNPRGTIATFELWALRAIWRDHQLSFKSPWILVAAVQTTTFFLCTNGFIGTDLAKLNHLTVPTLFIIGQILAMEILKREGPGRNSPFVRHQLLASLVALTTISLLLNGLRKFDLAFVVSDVVFAVKWFLGLAVAVLQYHNWTISKSEKGVPRIIQSLSQLVSAAIFVHIFFPPLLGGSLLTSIEQLVKVVAVLSIDDLVHTIGIRQRYDRKDGELLYRTIPLLIVMAAALFVGM